MNSIPLFLSVKASQDVHGLPASIHPAVMEQLSRISANHATCSRQSAFPHPPCLESGLWCREAKSASLIEVLFKVELHPARIVVRRVLVRKLDRIPDWINQPDEWGNEEPWPIVDV